MANNQIKHLLDIINEQLASEAFLLRVGELEIPANQVITRLTTGNTRNSRFTPVQADAFVHPSDGYEILAQYRNDPESSDGTGFSGTLVRSKRTNELMLSFRSTEFIDDAVRDGKSTNEMEIFQHGWAFGQIAEMEAWYAQLRNDPNLLAGRSFNVTGYSLGGHLATAFNILRREQYAAAPELNPVVATYTFNAPGTGRLNSGTLTALMERFNAIRADYVQSPEWLQLSPSERSQIQSDAQERVDAINAEEVRVAGLQGVANGEFGGRTAPKGGQAQLGYQIAVLLVKRNTVGAYEANLPSSIFNAPALLLAPPEQRFANMVEIVGSETGGEATNFVSNSGIHYGSRQRVHIEDQPDYRGTVLVDALFAFNTLVDNPSTNDMGDTHSLVLVIDSLSLMAIMERLSPTLTIEMAGEIFSAMSNASSQTAHGKQGKAEGDTLERMLDALRKLALGPTTTPTLNEAQMRKVLQGNTWHLSEFRELFHNNLKVLDDRVKPLVSPPNAAFTIDPLVTTSAAQLAALAQGSEAIAYRYALKELNPFALSGDTARSNFYDAHNINGSLDLYDSVARTGQLTNEWITDRAAFQFWKNFANTANKAAVQTLPGGEIQRYHDLSQNYVLPVAPGNFPSASSPRYLFGSDRNDRVDGGLMQDRLYGGSGNDQLSGGEEDDYLEGGRGVDVYRYNGSRSLLGPTNDGADTIRDIDGKGFIQYRYKPLTGDIESRVIGEASDKRTDTEWRSATGKFIFTKTGADLIITINGDAGGTITLTDFRDGDFGIHLRNARPIPQNPTRAFYGDKQDYDSDPGASGIQPVADGFGNYLRADGQDGRPDLVSPDREDIFYGSIAAGDVEFFALGDGNDQALADGNALYPASGGIAWMQGGDGRDMLHGGPAGDLIEAGSDGELLGEVGGDTAFGGFGDDEIHGDAKTALAEAIIQGATGAGTGLKGDFLSGGPGDDWVFGSINDDYLDGGSSNDLLIGGLGNDNISGDFGYGAITPNWVITREIISAEGDIRYQIAFTSGIDRFDTEPAGDDVIYAGDGIDWIYANGGDDFVDAGAGNDAAFGEAGADVLVGDAGDDFLVGDNPGIVAAADDGGDVLDGGAGNDTLQGNGGDDILAGGTDADVLTGDAGGDILNGGEGDDILYGDHPGFVSGADEGADNLDGGDGEDTLFGNGGDDILTGGPGNDVLAGGAGHDTYVFNRGDGTETIVDTDTSADHPDASVLVLGEGIDRAEIKFRTGSFLVDLGNGDQLHFQGFDQVSPADSAPLAAIQLADGTLLDYQDVLEQGFDIDGSDGHDNGQPGQSPTLLGTGVTDRMRGFSGDDVLYGRVGDDMLDGGDGADVLFGGAGADTLYGGTGDDAIWGAGDDGGVIALDGDDVVYAGSGGDQVDGGDGDDKLFGEGGADMLSGEAGSDTMDGGDGDDTLEGDAGNDILAGGPGVDTLQGQADDDVYLFAAGDGEDLLIEQSDATLDILRFGAGISPGELAFAHGPGSSLVAWHANGLDQVTIQNWYSGTANKLDRFEFADATEISSTAAEALAATSWRGGSGNDVLNASAAADTMRGLGGNDVLLASSGNDTLIGGRGDDVLDGGAGADTYRVSLNDGRDTIQETNEFVNNILVFEADIASSDVAFERIGSDLVLKHANGVDRVTVGNWFAPSSWYRIETVTFAADGVTFTRDQIRDAATLTDHHYTLALGDGAQVIDDWGGVDTLTFGAGIAKADVQLARIGVDLRLAHRNGVDHVTIKDWFNALEKQVENVTFSSTGESFTHAEMTEPFLNLTGTSGNDFLEGGELYGETINGLAGNDVIHGRGGPDAITGGTGNDTVYGGAGLDRYLFKAGDGNDVITEEHAEGGVLQLAPGLVDVITIASIANGRRLTFSGKTDSIDLIESGSGRIEIKGELNGTAAGNTLTGNNTFGDVIQGLGGNDTIQGRGGNDEIYGGTGNDTIDGGDGNDQLRGNEGDDVIDGGPGGANDLGGADQFWGGAGNDTLYGGSLQDWFNYDRGDGIDLIIDEPLQVSGIWYLSLHDQLVFGAGIDAESLTISPSGSNDLLVTLSPTERITLRNWASDIRYRIDEFVFSDGDSLDANEILMRAYTQRGTSGNDTLTGTANNDALYGMEGNDTLVGSSGNDFLDGGSGNDTLDGGAGDERYAFGTGGGQDRIIDIQGNDRVEFAAGTTAAQITLGRSLNSLVLGIAGTGDTLTIENFLADGNARVESFAFTDGSTLPDNQTIVDNLVGAFGTPENDVLQGTANFDVLYGYAGNDTLNALGDNDTVYGGEGDDALTGGTGNDDLQGEAGNDTYNYGLGSGTDLIRDTSGTDVVAFGTGIATSAVTPTRSGANLILSVNITGNVGAVTVTNYFSGQETEEIRFADGTTWDVATVRNRILAASSTAGNDLILGYDSADTINSLAGNDTVYAGAGNDVIDGGTGSDTLHGEDGNDILRAGTGDPKNATINNNLYGGNGDDVLVASGKTDLLSGDAGNDIALGAAGNETLQDSGGNNLLSAAAGSDNVRMGDSNDLALGGTGNDTIDGDSDANTVRGRDIVAFNKSDGIDTVSRIGAGSTLSIGGGTTYSNLAFAVSGSNLLLKTSNSNYISLTNWYGSPGEKNVATLQIVIEGTSNYNAGSSNPLNNRKIQTFNFLSLVAAYDAAGRPSNFNIANNLAAHRIGGSDTLALGGAAAYQYARTGTLGTLTNAQIQAVLTDPAFAVSAQSITPSAAASSESSALNDALATFSVDSSVESAAQSMESFNDPKSDFSPKAQSAPTSTIASESAADSANSSPERTLAAASTQPQGEAPAIAAQSFAGSGSAGPIAQWFDGEFANDDLSLLDDILHGEDQIAPQSRSAIAAEWERTHDWLDRHIDRRLGDSATQGDGTAAAAFSYIGIEPFDDTPRAAIGLAGIAGHEMKVFRGLQA